MGMSIYAEIRRNIVQKTLTFDCYGMLLDIKSLQQAVSDLASAHDLPPEPAVKSFPAVKTG